MGASPQPLIPWKLGKWIWGQLFGKAVSCIYVHMVSSSSVLRGLGRLDSFTSLLSLSALVHTALFSFLLSWLPSFLLPRLSLTDSFSHGVNLMAQVPAQALGARTSVPSREWGHCHAWHFVWGTESHVCGLGAQGPLGLVPWEWGAESQCWDGAKGQPCTPKAPSALLILTCFFPHLFPK